MSEARVQLGKQSLCTLEEFLEANQSLLDALPTALYVCAADGTIQRFNNRACELWGRTPKLGDTHERFCGSCQLYHLDGRSLAHEDTPMALALHTGAPQRDEEVVIERPDGSHVIVQVNIDPFMDRVGRVQGAVNAFHDVTARHRAEQEMRSSQAALEDFFENAPVAMHWVGADGTILRANSAELDLLGYRSEEYTGRNISEFHADGAAIEDILARLSRGERLENVPAKLRARDGTVVPVFISSNGHFREGELINTRCVTWDARAEEVAFQLGCIVESSNDAIISMDLNGTIMSWNPAAARMFGYSAPEACGQPIAMIIPEERRKEEAYILERVRRGERLDHFETVRRDSRGRVLDVSLTVSPVKDATGRIVGASKISRDITRRKQNEKFRQARTRELAALYTLVDKLHRALTRDDLCEAALDAITNAIGCNRASVLLFDDSGTMRFGAARGLSTEYRQAMEGYAHWPQDARNPQPIFVGDVREAEGLEQIKAVIREEGIGALAFIPLVCRGVLIGKFMTYYEAPHTFTDHEADVSLTIARQLAFSIERLRAEDELQRNEEWLRLATMSGKIGLWQWDIASNQVSWTDSLYGIHGLDKANFRGTLSEYCKLIHPDDRRHVLEALRRAVDEDENYELEFRVVRPDGRIVWLFTNAIVLRDSEGPTRMVGATMDVSERREAEKRLREKSAQLDTIMKTVPGLLWIAHDPEARSITRSRYAAEFLRLQTSSEPSSAARVSTPSPPFRVLKEGREVPPEDWPLLLAAKGQEVHGEELEVRFDDGVSRWQLFNARPIRGDDGRPLGAVGAALDVTERIEGERHRNLLIEELNHRVKNTLAVVLGIAHQTFRGGLAAPEARRAFEGRLSALAAAHNVLTKAHWESATLKDIAAGAVAVCGPPGRRIEIAGDPLILTPKQAGTFALALHELCTNALKYGALSNECGTVSFTWTISNAQGPRVRASWLEKGGPPVSPPGHRGFGSRMIKGALAQDLDGEVTMDFRPAGLVCLIDAPIQQKDV